MPYVKCISGHTSARGVQRYLEKNGRALATDFLNLDAPVKGVRDGLEDYAAFEWWREMDETRHAFGNDMPWRGLPARTWKHYILSPNPEDGIDLGTLRRLAKAWASENFPDFEVAIVYHDDNANGIPHAHVVVNNTNLATGHRIQEPDPRAVKRSVQKLAREMGLSCFEDAAPANNGKAIHARSRQKVHIGKTERELEAKGEYSWVADIRARVSIARMVSRNEREFRSVLGALDVTVSDNSPKAARRDWVYAFEDHPARRVSGEKMELLYSKQALEHRFQLGGVGRLGDATERQIYEIAASAYEVNDIAELRRLSDAMAVCEMVGARSIDDLKAVGPDLPRGLDEEKLAAAISFVSERSLLPSERKPVMQHPPQRHEEKPWEKNRPSWMRAGKSTEGDREQAQRRSDSRDDGRGNRDAR